MMAPSLCARLQYYYYYVTNNLPPTSQPTDEEEENPLQLNPQLPSFLPQSNSFPSWIRFRSCYDLFYWKIMRYVVGVAFCLLQSHRVCGCFIWLHSTEREQEENWFNSQKSKPTIESTYPLPKTMTRGQGMDPIQIFKRRISPLPLSVPSRPGPGKNGQRINRPFDGIAD